jgi:hypothetical protein
MKCSYFSSYSKSANSITELRSPKNENRQSSSRVRDVEISCRQIIRVRRLVAVTRSDPLWLRHDRVGRLGGAERYRSRASRSRSALLCNNTTRSLSCSTQNSRRNVVEDVEGYSDMPPVGSSGLSTIFVEVSLTWTFQQRPAHGALASGSLCNLRHVKRAGVVRLYEEPWLDNCARMLRLIPIAGPLKTLMCLPGVVT